LESEATELRKAASAEASLASAEVPTGTTLPDGLFTRIRSAKGNGVAVAQCAKSEWLTGGSCSPMSGGELRRFSEPQVGADGSARGGRWSCETSHPDVLVTAFAICASVRAATAEQAVATDAGPAAD
jgi:hypothetical protein